MQLTLFVGGIIIGIILVNSFTKGALIGIPLIFFSVTTAWIWGIISGIEIIKEAS